MSYLTSFDYKRQIQTDNLMQIIGSDTSVLAGAELAAQEEVTSYLTQKYDLAQEMTDTHQYNSGNTYKAKDRVYDKDGVLYYGALPKPEFDYTQYYAKGDQVYWKGKVYTCAISSRMDSPASLLQYGEYANIPPYNIFPDSPAGAIYWGAGTTYTIDATVLITDAKWTKGDNRSQQMVMVMVDIALYHVHSRISPRNIPDLRVKRYDEALNWLKAAGTGKITANLPLKQVHSGSRIRFGGNVKRTNHY